MITFIVWKSLSKSPSKNLSKSNRTNSSLKKSSSKIKPRKRSRKPKALRTEPRHSHDVDDAPGSEPLPGASSFLLAQHVGDAVAQRLVQAEVAG